MTFDGKCAVLHADSEYYCESLDMGIGVGFVGFQGGANTVCMCSSADCAWQSADCTFTFSAQSAEMQKCRVQIMGSQKCRVQSAENISLVAVIFLPPH